MFGRRSQCARPNHQLRCTPAHVFSGAACFCHVVVTVSRVHCMAPKLHVDWGLQEAVNAMNGLLMIHPWHIAQRQGMSSVQITMLLLLPLQHFWWLAAGASENQEQPIKQPPASPQAGVAADIPVRPPLPVPKMTAGQRPPVPASSEALAAIQPSTLQASHQSPCNKQHMCMWCCGPRRQS